MHKNSLLSTTNGWNLLLYGCLKTRLLRGLGTALEDMAEEGKKPDLNTFKTIVDGLAAMDKYHSYTLAIYDYWREFIKEFPSLQPDIDFINKLLYCCRMCRNMDRALFFLAMVEECGVKPNIATFKELLAVSA